MRAFDEKVHLLPGVPLAEDDLLLGRDRRLHHHAEALDDLVGEVLEDGHCGAQTTLRMQLQPVIHCSSLVALDPSSGR